MGIVDNFDSNDDLQSWDTSAESGAPEVGTSARTETFARFMKDMSLVFFVMILSMVGTWGFLHRDRVYELVTAKPSLGKLITGKTWREHKRSRNYGPFDTVLWWEAADDPDRKAYFEEFYTAELPETKFEFETDFQLPADFSSSQ